MMKVVVVLLLAVGVLTGCAKQSENIVFTAVVIDVAENSILVETSDNVGFSRANAGLSDLLNLSFRLTNGQRVEIEILPEIRQGDPVQVTAVRMRLLQDIRRAEYRRITPEQAMEMMKGSNVIILDVRTQFEYDSGHIRGAVLFPYTEISTRAAQVLPDKHQTILIYCRTGRRSLVAANILVEMGYTGVYDFGGIVSWPGEVVR